MRLRYHSLGRVSRHRQGFPALPAPYRKSKSGAADTAHNVHEIGYIVLYKKDAVQLLPQVQCRNQDQGDGQWFRYAYPPGWRA